MVPEKTFALAQMLIFANEESARKESERRKTKNERAKNQKKHYGSSKQRRQ